MFVHKLFSVSKIIKLLRSDNIFINNFVVFPKIGPVEAHGLKPTISSTSGLPEV